MLVEKNLKRIYKRPKELLVVGKNGVLIKWYNTCEGIGLVYHDIDPYARKDKSQNCT